MSHTLLTPVVHLYLFDSTFHFILYIPIYRNALSLLGFRFLEVREFVLLTFVSSGKGKHDHSMYSVGAQ